MQKLETARQLEERLNAVLDTVEREFRPLTDEQLHRKPASQPWSIVDCLQHLNLAERFYIRNLQHKVDALGLIQTQPTDQTLKAGLAGRLLRKAVDPQGSLPLPPPPLTTPRTESLSAPDVVAQFVELQQLLKQLLDRATYLDWNGSQMPTLYGNWLKVNVGDALLMVVARTERYVNQAMRVKAAL